LGSTRACPHRGPLRRLTGHDQGKLRSIIAAQASGHVASEFNAGDVYVLVTAMAYAWSPASLTIAADLADAPAVHQRRKLALAAAVRGAFCR